MLHNVEAGILAEIDCQFVVFSNRPGKFTTAVLGEQKLFRQPVQVYLVTILDSFVSMGFGEHPSLFAQPLTQLKAATSLDLGRPK